MDKMKSELMAQAQLDGGKVDMAAIGGASSEMMDDQ